MKTSINIVTNKIDGKKFVVMLFDEESKMLDKIDTLKVSDICPIYYGKTEGAFNLTSDLKVGSNVRYYLEQKWHDGTITSLQGFPYIEVSPTGKPTWSFSVHKKFVENKNPSTKFILDNFIVKLSDNKYKKYDLGIIKNESKFFRTPEASLRDLFKKGKFVILTILK